VPRLGYLNARTAEHIHLFCAGYEGYGHSEDAERIGDVSYDNGIVIPWWFSQRRFAEFVNDMEASTSWRYSGEADLILVSPDLQFTEAIVYDLEAMIRDGALDSPAHLFEAIISFARSRGEDASTWELSDKQGLQTFGEVTAEAIVDLLPKPLRRRGDGESIIAFRISLADSKHPRCIDVSGSREATGQCQPLTQPTPQSCARLQPGNPETP